jgi:hypothetical protein
MDERQGAINPLIKITEELLPNPLSVIRFSR